MSLFVLLKKGKIVILSFYIFSFSGKTPFLCFALFKRTLSKQYFYYFCLFPQEWKIQKEIWDDKWWKGAKRTKMNTKTTVDDKIKNKWRSNYLHFFRVFLFFVQWNIKLRFTFLFFEILNFFVVFFFFFHW